MQNQTQEAQLGKIIQKKIPDLVAHKSKLGFDRMMADSGFRIC